MKVRNVHQREVYGSIEQLGQIVKTQMTPQDRLWPREKWPQPRLEGSPWPSLVGKTGFHGPVHFVFTSHETVANVSFGYKFIKPAGFDGHHKFSVTRISAEKLLVTAVVEMETRGLGATLFWLLAVGPLHDAIVEDTFDKVERELGNIPQGAQWSIWVKMVRTLRLGTRANLAADRRLREKEIDSH